MAEKAALADKKAKSGRKAVLLEALAEKQNSALKEMSAEDLQKELDALEA